MLYATVRQRKIHVKNPVTVIQNGIGVDWLVLDMDDEWQKMDSIAYFIIFKNMERIDGPYTFKQFMKEKDKHKISLTFKEQEHVPF